jgi:hypothetical protein
VVLAGPLALLRLRPLARLGSAKRATALDGYGRGARWPTTSRAMSFLRGASVRLYHATSIEAAEAILRDGFREGHPHWAFQHDLGISGVWLADHPVDENEGAQRGDVLLAVDLPDHLRDDHELIEDDKPSGTWIVPAAILNCYPVTRMLA